MGTRIRQFLFVVALAPVLPAGIPLAGADEAPATVEEAEVPVVATHRGAATYYGGRFHGRRTASGERFDQNAMVAAHPSLPFGTVVRVTNVRNGVSTQVRIVDRGPAKGPRRRGVIIDLSRGAARELGFIKQGRTPVKLEVLGPSALDSDLLAPGRSEAPG